MNYFFLTIAMCCTLIQPPFTPSSTLMPQELLVSYCCSRDDEAYLWQGLRKNRRELLCFCFQNTRRGTSNSSQRDLIFEHLLTDLTHNAPGEQSSEQRKSQNMSIGQENARSLRLDRSGDWPGGSFRHVVGSAVMIRNKQFAFPTS